MPRHSWKSEDTAIKSSPHVLKCPISTKKIFYNMGRLDKIIFRNRNRNKLTKESIKKSLAINNYRIILHFS